MPEIHLASCIIYPSIIYPSRIIYHIYLCSSVSLHLYPSIIYPYPSYIICHLSVIIHPSCIIRSRFSISSPLRALFPNIFMISIEENILPKLELYLCPWIRCTDAVFAYAPPGKIMMCV